MKLKGLTKEELIELGLAPEVAEQIATAHNATMEAIEGELTTAQTTISALQGDIRKRDEDLDALRQSDAGTLQTTLADLQAKYTEDQKNHSIAIESLKLLGGKVHDPDMVIGLLDKGKLVFDKDGKLQSGLKEQFAAIEKEKSFLWIPDQGKGTPTFRGAKTGEAEDGLPGSDPNKEAVEFAKSLAADSKSDSASKATSHYFGE